MKKIVNFLDKHRLLLVLIILLFISLIFFSIKVYQFKTIDFKKLECTKDAHDNYCFNKETLIFVNPENAKNKFFKENKKQIEELKKNYKLPDFNFYTAYYYEVTSLLDYKNSGENKYIYDFFKILSNTYSLEEIYKKNTFYYEIFYPYKISLNTFYF